jgi:hypothetical protein
MDQVLAWLDLPASERPSLFAVYFSAVDSAVRPPPRRRPVSSHARLPLQGHAFGPDSPEVGQAVHEVDNMIGTFCFQRASAVILCASRFTAHAQATSLRSLRSAGWPTPSTSPSSGIDMRTWAPRARPADTVTATMA